MLWITQHWGGGGGQALVVDRSRSSTEHGFTRQDRSGAGRSPGRSRVSNVVSSTSVQLSGTELSSFKLLTAQFSSIQFRPARLSEAHHSSAQHRPAQLRARSRWGGRSNGDGVRRNKMLLLKGFCVFCVAHTLPQTRARSRRGGKWASILLQTWIV